MKIVYDYHKPVLLKESIKFLFNENLIGNENVIDNKKRIYIDGTLGGGGHASIILQKIKFGGILFAFDKDTAAINRARSLFEEEIKAPSPSLYLCNCSFSAVKNVLKEHNIHKIDGIILDLGVSSKQLDTSQIGLSYRIDCPLDMRFDGDLDKSTAKEILNTYPENKLSAIFFEYGEEPKSKIVADAIVRSRQIKPISTTFDLRSIIEQCIHNSNKFPVLSRIFQALRIAVNDELGELEATLLDIISMLEVGGRIVVISYHSLEDRIVKNTFKQFSYTTKKNKYKINELNNTTTNSVPKLNLLFSKPYTPSLEEIIDNPRSRSAKMRVAEGI
jgi:16S rRNA (cytosine1402-N4)-methyltransferase